MAKRIIDWIARFSIMCALNYSKIVLTSAAVALLIAMVLLILRSQALKEESWLSYLGAAFLVFSIQYGLRSYAAIERAGDYGRTEPRTIETFAQAVFSNLNSLFFVAAALTLLYWFPQRLWRTRLAWLLIGIFLASGVAGILLREPWSRRFDALLSACVLGLLGWALYLKSGTWKRWASLNLVGGSLYAFLHVIYAFVPKFARWPPLVARMSMTLHPPATPSIQEALDDSIFALAFLLKLLLFFGAFLVAMRCLSIFAP